MQWRTLIVNSDNWVIGEHENKDILIWSIKDRPWYNLRTYGLEQVVSLPFQLKTNSWTSVEVNSDATVPQSVSIEKMIIGARINFFAELYHRLNIATETLGLANANDNMLALHEYLVATGIIRGQADQDSAIQYENKIRLLQDLNNIKKTVIDTVMVAKSVEDFKMARTTMERLFFTNILL
jgi:hypothetical protein